MSAYLDTRVSLYAGRLWRDEELDALISAPDDAVMDTLRLAQYRELRVQTQRELAEAYHWLGIVQMRMGGQMLHQASVGLKPAVAIKVVARSSVGVQYPSVTAEALPLQPVGLMWTDVSFDEARLRLRDLTVTLARLGEAAAGGQPQDAETGQCAEVQHHPALPGDGAAHPRRTRGGRAQHAVPDQGAARTQASLRRASGQRKAPIESRTWG